MKNKFVKIIKTCHRTSKKYHVHPGISCHTALKRHYLTFYWKLVGQETQIVGQPIMCGDNNSFTTFVELWSTSTTKNLQKKIRVTLQSCHKCSVNFPRKYLTCITSSIPNSRHPPAFGSYSWVPWYHT